MAPRALRLFANALIALFALDAGVSLAEEGLRAATGFEGLLALRNALAQLVLFGACLCLPLLLLTPRLPIAVFLPLALTTLWLGWGMAPLPLWIEGSAGLGIIGAALQLAVAGAVFAGVRRHNRGSGWWFRAEATPLPAFSLRRTLGFGAATLFVGLPAAALYAALLLLTWMQVSTQGFLSFDQDGIWLADRHYAREGQEIRLVGMMHIGEEQAYRELVAGFARESTVVLAEGISDRASRLRGGLSYGRAAEALGLHPQQDLRFYLIDPENPDAPLPEWPVVRHADVDADDFSPQTLEWLAWAGEVWESDGLASALRQLLTRARDQDPAVWRAIQHDLLDARNAHLFGEIRSALEEYDRVVVPWGALHLPAVERVVLDWEFQPTRSERRPLIGWSTIGAALY